MEIELGNTSIVRSGVVQKSVCIFDKNNNVQWRCGGLCKGTNSARYECLALNSGGIDYCPCLTYPSSPNVTCYPCRWFRNNQLLEGETSNMLIIHQISYDYNGDIIACTASNRVGRTRKEMTLKVECK